MEICFHIAKIETIYEMGWSLKLLHSMKTETDSLWITEVPPSVSLYVGIDPLPVGRHTTINIREALLVKVLKSFMSMYDDVLEHHNTDFWRVMGVSFVNAHPSTAKTPADDSHQCVPSIFLHSQWTPTVTLARRCSWLDTAKHVIREEVPHRYTTLSWNSVHTTRNQTRALFAFVITQDNLSSLLKNWADRGQGVDTRGWSGSFYFPAPTINWSSVSSVVCIFWCKASWRKHWQVNLLFQLEKGNIVHLCIVVAIILMYDNLLNLQISPTFYRNVIYNIVTKYKKEEHQTSLANHQDWRRKGR